MARNARRRRGGLWAAAFMIGALVSAPAAATAYWSASASVSSVAAATPARVAPVITCTSMSGLLGIGDTARLTWPAVPGATGYTVTVTTLSTPPGTASATTTATQYDVRGGLLTGLVGNGNMTVVANFGTSTTWVSPASNQKLIGPANVLAGLLGGTKCL